MSRVVKKVFHMFGAIGGGAKGFKRAKVQLGGMQGEWECIGSVDVDAAANRVFQKRVGVPATTLDLADLAQYVAINGRAPAPGWREAGPDDIRHAANGHRPDCIFLSAPCKGFSGLLSEAKSGTAKYVAMNGLAERGLFLALTAWADDPVPLILFENVPRLLTRGREFVNQLIAMMQSFGYATRETVHDCGELGALGQSRKRCLIVARHMEKVPNFLYEPPKRALRSVGEIIGKLWMPGDDVAGPLHRIPQLQWKTWVRLAFVEAGSDWRSLNKLAVEDGMLRDYLLVPAMHRGGYGVRRWDDTSGVVASESRPSNGAFSVADPRIELSAKYTHAGFRVVQWDRGAGTVTCAVAPGSSAQAVADPRPGWNRHSNALTVMDWDHASRAVIAGGKGVQGGWMSVADPRPNRDGKLFTKYPVTAWEGASGTVIGGDDAGAYAVADPRSGMAGDRAAYLSGGHYGVVPWIASSGAVSAAACHDNGRWSVADPRAAGFAPTSQPEEFNMPAADQKMVAHIWSLDGTRHRPFTTLELSALQSLFDPEDPRDVAAFTEAYTSVSKSDSTYREWTGNAVPPEGIEPVAIEMLRTLMLADAGETFQLSNTPVWVRPVIAGLALAQGDAS